MVSVITYWSILIVWTYKYCRPIPHRFGASTIKIRHNVKMRKKGGMRARTGREGRNLQYFSFYHVAGILYVGDQHVCT